MKKLFSLDGDYVEFMAELKYQTDDAYLLDIDDKEVWIPKSQVEDFEQVKGTSMYKIAIPEWLADKKELT